MRIPLGLAAIAIALCASPAFASEEPGTAAQPDAADQMVCKIEKPATGSRTNFHRVCKTRTQWENESHMPTLHDNPAMTVRSHSAMPSGGHN